MIYLWHSDTGWEEHEITDTEALKERSIQIGAGARVGEGAWVGDAAWVGEGATVGAGATVAAGARVGARARVGEGAWVGEGATVGAGATVGDGARVGARARVGEGATPKIVYIIGSRFPVSYWGEDRIDIGCQQHSIAEWLEHGDAIGKRYEFTDEQKAEYRLYIEMIAKTHAAEKGE